MKMKVDILKNFLRILSPLDIEELTSTSEGESRVSLTDMLDKQLEDDGRAKILPFKRPGDDTAASEVEAKDETEEGSDNSDESEGHEESQAEFTEEEDLFGTTEVEVEEEKVDTIQFILDEQRKSKKNHEKLKKREVMDLYIKNASISIEQEKKTNQDLSKSAYSGVLVNKKRA
jgi:hypothetical protein